MTYRGILVAATILFVALSYGIISADGFQNCISHQGQYAPDQTTNDQASGSLVASKIRIYMACFGGFANAYGVAITAIATLLLTFVTGGLVFLGWRQLNTSRIQLRAYVFPTGIFPYWERDEVTQRYNWRFRVGWSNSGETATQHLRTEVYGEVRSSILPRGFNFHITGGNDVNGVIPPKSSMQSGIVPSIQLPIVSAQDIVDSQFGRKFIFIYGWMRYRDVFPRSSEHITRFCWSIQSVGDPLTFIPNDGEHPLSFSYITHTEGNCSDDECVVMGLG